MSKSTSSERHTEYVQTTFTAKQREAVEAAAKRDGRTLSAYIRVATLAAVNGGDK